ncbi:MAG: hypothetical protein JXR96_14105 [Deltaproteobacteria bacterium]|nr:hypothetical protein [Deltaproteobacteria bacterium]
MDPRDDLSPGDRLLRLDPAETARQLDALPLEEQVAAVIGLPPGRKRQDLALASSRPAELVRFLPPEDLVITIKEIGDPDALPLVELSSNAQLNYLFDLDLWFQAGMDLERVEHWLELLFECGPERVLRWARHADFELLVLLLERVCLQVDREAVDDLPEAVAGRVFSPDQVHVLVVKLGVELDLVRSLLELLCGQDQELFLALMGNLGTTPLAELEELALRWRDARLADRGWPDLDEALAFFQPRDRSDLPAAGPPRGLDNAPHYPLQVAGQRLFAAGLERIADPAERHRLASQIANLINRVLVADGMQVGELEALARAAERVYGRLEIGLSELGAISPDSAARVASTVPLLYVAQVAQKALQQRGARIRGLRAEAGDLFALLAEPLRSRLQSAAAARPLFLPPGCALPRDFASPADLQALDADLDRSEAAVRLGQALGLGADRLPATFPEGSFPGSIEAIDLELLLLTCFARAQLGLEPLAYPVPQARLPELFSGLPGDAASLRARIEAWARERIGTAELPGLSELAGELARRLASGLLVLDPRSIDPRFVDGLWIQAEQTARP